MEPQTSTFQAIGEEDDSQERIQELEKELARLKADWEENEQKVRDECCNEWIEIVTKMEKSWNQRYEDTKARYEEFCENRVDGEYRNKCEEMAIVQQENERLLKELEQTKETLSDVQAELEQSNLLLTDANERLDVKEEELVNLEEKLMKAVKFLTE